MSWHDRSYHQLNDRSGELCESSIDLLEPRV